MTNYVLDACVLIDANQRYYGLTFCTAFWNWLIIKNGQGRIFSIDLVLNEILPKGPELYHWSRSEGNCIFQKTISAELENITREIETWLKENEFSNEAIDEFKEGADVGLIAYAKLHNQTLVTLEKGSESKRRVKIPVVCKGLGVPVVDTFEMLWLESPEFVLRK